LLFYEYQDLNHNHMIKLIDYIHQVIKEIHFENNIVYDMYHNEKLENIHKHMLMVDKMVKFYELYLMLLEQLVL